MSAELTSRCFNSIQQIEEELWDSILPEGDLIHSYKFIKILEDAGVEDSRFWYLLFYKGNQLVGTAALSAFRVNIGLFLDKGIQEKISRMRKIFPRLLLVDVLFCGMPISLGQNHLVIGDELLGGEILELLNKEMERLARSEKINYLCFKEFKIHEMSDLDILRSFGFFEAHSIPYVTLDIRWRSFDDYLQELRYPYRRAILKSLNKLKVEEPFLMYSQEIPTPDKHGITWTIGGKEVCTPEQFYELYLLVMARTDTRLEMLNLAYFQLLYEKLGSALRVMAVRDGDEVLSAALLLEEGEQLTFILAGNKYLKDHSADPYFNLVNGILAYAITNEFKTIGLGQTAYWTKQRLGGQLIPEFIWFKARSKLMNQALRSFRKLLFPVMSFKTPRVFKDNGISGDNQQHHEKESRSPLIDS